MQASPVTTVIDQESCVGCGLCVQVCPMGTLKMLDGIAYVSSERSMNCGHCAAVCPVNAVSVGSLENHMSDFSSFEPDRRCIDPGEFDTAALVGLMASRRSCREFLEKSVPSPVLGDLVKIAVTAPSAGNSQLWSFTILPTPKEVAVLRDQMVVFYERLNRLVDKRWFRAVMTAVGKKSVRQYHQSGYHDYVKNLLEQWELHRKDRFLHSAPAVVIVGSKPGAMLPVEDALLATQNMLLAAHAMGLGTCIIGLAGGAMKRNPTIQRTIGIPREESIHSVIALGYPDIVYERPAGRKEVVPRYFEA